MQREHIRPWVVAAWVVLGVLTAVLHAADTTGALGGGSDCVDEMMAELRPLDRLIPRNAPLLYVGPIEVGGGCRAGWVIRNALAPRIVFDRETRHHSRHLEERGLVAAPRPRIVLAWGDEGREWLSRHPRVRVLYRASEHVRVGYVR